jgi:hypothetical protein
MRLLSWFSKGLLGAGLVAGALLSMSGCGDYAIFKVVITSIDTPLKLSEIAYCKITITDENKETVLDHHDLNGCKGLTNKDIGTFSYSSSRSSGTLNFIVEAYDAQGYDPSDRTKHRLQWNEDNKPGDIGIKA